MYEPLDSWLAMAALAVSSEVLPD
uniref:Uncharacterized protein n=1 Tax=Latilactobacillus sakei TaxID=1599 RepID=A0A2H1MY99_LATSK|nr:Protein of unknown function [Latilactobacillus sakei]